MILALHGAYLVGPSLSMELRARRSDAKVGSMSMQGYQSPVGVPRKIASLLVPEHTLEGESRTDR